MTFSLDAPASNTHDQLRGKGSYRQVLRAVSICVVRDLPFTFNMVLTRQNQHLVQEMVSLAGQLGSRGVRFGHLMPTPDTHFRHLDLSPDERRSVETTIWKLRELSAVPVGMASGYYSSAPFFACGPLELDEYNLDYQGNLTLCCQLSGHSGPNRDADVIGNLSEISLAAACARFTQRVATYLADKQARIDTGKFGELDHFPCWYCLQYLNKVDALQQIPHHPWTRRRDTPRGQEQC